MYAVWVNVIVACQHDLKIKPFHVFVEVMSNFFFSVYIFEHSLEYHFEQSRDVLGNVSVIFSSFYELPDFFTFSLESLLLEAVLSMADDPPTLSNGEAVAPRWISSAIFLCIFIYVVEYFYFYFVLWLLLFLLFFFFLFHNFFCDGGHFFSFQITIRSLFIYYFFTFFRFKIFLFLLKILLLLLLLLLLFILLFNFYYIFF